MTDQILLYPVIIPVVAAIIALFVTNAKGVKEGLTMLAVTANLIIAVMLFNKEMVFNMPWAGFGFDFSLRLYHFSSFILLAAAGFGFLVGLYSIAFMEGKNSLNQYYSYFLITLGFVNGAALAENLVLMLFFWEGLLLVLFGLIYIGHKDAYPSAIKAFVISGVADVCMMLGIALTGSLAGSLNMTKIHLPLEGLAIAAFIFMMIGATAKAGSMPFHSWIPDAAVDAPLPFMAFVPAALEKLVGIYFLSRITLDLFKFTPESWLSTLLMVIGAVTILLAVMMALIQTDYKRLLSYHAISQVGYMILGIGTGVPAGIVGGIFHMINHAMYKCCLFLTGGSVEKQAGTTDLKKLGGLAKTMPITFTCFIVAAASISGVPPFNGFFSKELVYDGALERGWIFYAAALLGSFLTAASFLKLGHAAYLDKPSGKQEVKEAPLSMLVPMIVLAFLCVLFGVYNPLPLNNLIQPILGERLEGHNFAGFPHSAFLVVMTLVVLGLAYLNHMYGVKKTGKGSGASDHIHYAPGLKGIYAMAERRVFDPYEIGMKLMLWLSVAARFVDKAVDWIYEVFAVKTAESISYWIRELHNGSYAVYLMWSILGLTLIVVFFLMW
ncbi:MAG: NADH-quinone oxidoreductase subunit L [Firmicutes bacterium]|nr:NADH-quinone oxidoreductase subunit L [Bacillota bacterium]